MARYVAYAIPIIALIAVSATYALSVLPIQSYPAVVDFTFQMQIEFSNRNSTQVRAVAPANPIGEAGGDWATTQYNSYGTDSSHYPIYMDSPTTACHPACLIHVKSRVAHSFVLGDFFNVWGKPLGQNDTIGQPSNGSFYWDLCVGSTASASNAYSSTEWGNLVLTSNMYLTLLYYDHSNGLGCSPS